MERGTTLPAVGYSHFDPVHWSKVSAARRDQGLALSPARGQTLPGHRLAGASLVERETGHVYRVEKVYQDWYNGWFVTALIERNGSHGTCVVDSISCRDAGMLAALADFERRFAGLQ